MFNPPNRRSKRPTSYTEAVSSHQNSIRFFQESQRQLLALRELFSQEFSESRPAIKGLKYQNIPGDGNCLFNAIFRSITERTTIKSQKDLRRLAHDYLQRNFDQYSPFFELEEGQTPQNYLAQLLRDGVWGTNTEVMALMHVLQRPIYVITGGRITNTNDILFVGKPPIFLSFNGENHYDALLLEEGMGSQQVIDALLESSKLEVSPAKITEKTLLDHGLCTRNQLMRLKVKNCPHPSAGNIFLSYLLKKDGFALLKNKHLCFEQILQLPTPAHLFAIIKLYALHPAEIVKEHLDVAEISKLSYWKFILLIDKTVNEIEQNKNNRVVENTREGLVFEYDLGM